MKIKTQLTLASIIAAGLLASGCSQQMVAQQATQSVVEPIVEPMPEPETIVKTIVDCSSCNQPAPVVKPQPRPVAKKCWHGRNAQGECNPAPRAKQPVYQPRPAPKPAPVVKQCWHGRNAQGECNPAPRAKQPVYQPRPVPVQKPMPTYQQPVQPVMPKVKAKGTYRGPISIDQRLINQYQY